MGDGSSPSSRMEGIFGAIFFFDALAATGTGADDGSDVGADFAPADRLPVTPEFLTVLLTLFFGGSDFIGCLRRGLHAKDTRRGEF